MKSLRLKSSEKRVLPKIAVAKISSPISSLNSSPFPILSPISSPISSSSLLPFSSSSYSRWFQAISAAFALDQPHYNVVFIIHSAHQSLDVHLGGKGVAFMPISTPPVLSVHQVSTCADSELQSFSTRKKMIRTQHRQECLSAVERVFGDSESMPGDFIVINFFALEGWSLVELYQVQCVVAAPYVLPYRSAGKMFNIGCGHSFQKIGAHGEVIV